MSSIRIAVPGDFDLLRSLGIETFRETFAHSTTPQNLNLYLAQAFAPDRLSEELADPHSVFFIAFEKEDALGYAKLRTGRSPAGLEGQNAIELQRMYVRSAAHGRGVAQKLMDTCLTEARRRGHSAVWLGVWTENHRAQRFYRRNEFTPFGSQIFQMGNDPQTDILMKRGL